MGKLRTMYVTTDGTRYHDIARAQRHQDLINDDEAVYGIAKTIIQGLEVDEATLLKKLNKEFKLVYDGLDDMLEHLTRMHIEVPEITDLLNKIDSALKDRQTSV